MMRDAETLIKTVEEMGKISVLVVGDLMLDRYVWGSAERISDEAPVPIVKVKSVENRLGGAGNVVENLYQLGVGLKVCGFIGDDDDGRLVLDLLKNKGIDKDGILVTRGRPTTKKTRVLARSQQVVRIDNEDIRAEGKALQQGFTAVVDANIESCQAIILSDYGKGVVSQSLLASLDAARKDGRIGLNARPLVVDPSPVNYDHYSGISLATPNRKESEIASGVSITDQASALEAGKKMIERWDAEMMLVTLGAEGLLIVPPGGADPKHLEVTAQEVFDVSGAGDTVIAVYTAALAVGADPVLAGDLANIAAGIVVSEVGTVPVQRDRLIEKIRELSRKESL